MSFYHISRPAREDLDRIWDYIAVENLAPEAADRLIDKFHAQFRQLGAQPLMGRPREEFAPKLRSFPVANYLIFYRPLENGVEIVRVLYGGRDLENLFRE